MGENALEEQSEDLRGNGSIAPRENTIPAFSVPGSMRNLFDLSNHGADEQKFGLPCVNALETEPEHDLIKELELQVNQQAKYGKKAQALPVSIPIGHNQFLEPFA